MVGLLRPQEELSSAVPLPQHSRKVSRRSSASFAMYASSARWGTLTHMCLPAVLARSMACSHGSPLTVKVRSEACTRRSHVSSACPFVLVRSMKRIVLKVARREMSEGEKLRRQGRGGAQVAGAHNHFFCTALRTLTGTQRTCAAQTEAGRGCCARTAPASCRTGRGRCRCSGP